jgi:hypothetical protein
MVNATEFLDQIAFTVDIMCVSDSLNNLKRDFPALQAQFLESFGTELFDLTLCLEKGISSAPFALKYVDA